MVRVDGADEIVVKQGQVLSDIGLLSNTGVRFEGHGQLHAKNGPVWSKNSCGLALVVFQEPAEPFATVNGARTPFVCS